MLVQIQPRALPLSQLIKSKYMEKVNDYVQKEQSSSGKVICAVVITALVLMLAGAIGWANYERVEKVEAKEQLQQQKATMDSLAIKQAVDIIALQESVRNMATDVVVANAASESDLVKKAINDLKITVTAKSDSINKTVINN